MVVGQPLLNLGHPPGASARARRSSCRSASTRRARRPAAVDRCRAPVAAAEKQAKELRARVRAPRADAGRSRSSHRANASNAGPPPSRPLEIVEQRAADRRPVEAPTSAAIPCRTVARRRRTRAARGRQACGAVAKHPAGVGEKRRDRAQARRRRLETLVERREVARDQRDDAEDRFAGPERRVAAAGSGRSRARRSGSRGSHRRVPGRPRSESAAPASGVHAADSVQCSSNGAHVCRRALEACGRPVRQPCIVVVDAGERRLHGPQPVVALEEPIEREVGSGARSCRFSGDFTRPGRGVRRAERSPIAARETTAPRR